MSNIEMDFVTDWQNSMIEEMKEEGLEFNENIPNGSLIIMYLTFLRRKVSKKHRKVHKSKEFRCPKELENGLNKLINAIEIGDDLTPYLSKKIDDLVYKDGMFNDWGIHHLHLGDRMDGKFIERTGPLLFVLFKDDDAYLINIYKHKDWTKKDVLQTIYNNWPALIEPYVFKDVKALAYEYTENDHQKLRNAGMNVLIELEEKSGRKIVIMAPGMGITSSGDSTNDVRAYQQQIKLIHDLELLVENSLDYIKKIMQDQKFDIPLTLKFSLVNDNSEWLIKEENTNLIFNLTK